MSHTPQMSPSDSLQNSPNIYQQSAIQETIPEQITPPSSQDQLGGQTQLLINLNKQVMELMNQIELKYKPRIESLERKIKQLKGENLEISNKNRALTNEIKSYHCIRLQKKANVISVFNELEEEITYEDCEIGYQPFGKGNLLRSLKKNDTILSLTPNTNTLIQPVTKHCDRFEIFSIPSMFPLLLNPTEYYVTVFDLTHVRKSGALKQPLNLFGISVQPNFLDKKPGMFVELKETIQKKRIAMTFVESIEDDDPKYTSHEVIDKPLTKPESGLFYITTTCLELPKYKNHIPMMFPIEWKDDSEYSVYYTVKSDQHAQSCRHRIHVIS
ncbi:Uncharacterized protein QTN25_009775 [Entamoeba marina]